MMPRASGQRAERPLLRRTVADAMITVAKLSPADATVGDVRGVFRDPHVHAALVVDGDALVCVIDREDLGPTVADHEPASRHGTLAGRVIPLQMSLRQARQRMGGRRRLAVVDEHGVFRGLLCLNNSGRGFCSDADVLARAQDGSPA